MKARKEKEKEENDWVSTLVTLDFDTIVYICANPVTPALILATGDINVFCQKMVLRGCCHCHSCVFSFSNRHSWLNGLVPCHLEIHQITLFCWSWFRREHCRSWWDDQREPTFTSHVQSHRNNGSAKAKRGIWLQGRRSSIVDRLLFRLLDLHVWSRICALKLACV